MTQTQLPTPFSASYRRQVWLAVSALAGFMLLYFVLAGWFLYTAYRVLWAAESFTVSGVFVGVGALFLAVFMLKPLFFVRSGSIDGAVEVTAREQPRLFAFLHALADSAEAPRPHRVFLSARVNAAVFYDLSLVNLLFPSKKNLEIGLPLVNALTLGEARAVLAHEFGHFSQRSMAVLRWSQIAHQIAAHLVARRDKLDELLSTISRIDLRVAWIGWILSLVVWSIRSLVDSAFQGVVLLQHALSREMEMQADLVAVSLTGSDALIHALYRLQAADDSWGRTLRFIDSERARDRVPRDVLALHAQILRRMAEILNDPAYGRVAHVPADRPAEHRLFSRQLGQPPRMWHTHPLNYEREENAKRRYLPMAIDDASTWTLFDDVDGVREQVSAVLLTVMGNQGKDRKEPVTVNRSLEALNAQFDRPYLSSRYRGVYLNRSIVRGASRVDDLVGPVPPDWRERLDGLYPETLIEEIARLRALEQEVAQLRAIDAGTLHAAEGIVLHRGRNLRRRELPKAIEQVEHEAHAIERRLWSEDRLCRSVHLAAAQALGGEWAPYLRGLLSALHYADHTAANLGDLRGLLAYVVQLVTVTRRVSSAGVQRTLDAANALYDALQQVYGASRAVKLDSSLLQRMEIESWGALFEEFKLQPATSDNIDSWLNVIGGWVGQAVGACELLHNAALEQLLLTEAALAEHVRAGTSPGPAPAPATVPPEYDQLLIGAERPRPAGLSWWQRFQIADGVLPAAARFAVAAGIVGMVLGFGGGVGTSSVTIYNGLARPVVVDAGVDRMLVSARSSVTLHVDAGQIYTITTHTPQGQPIDSFTAEVPKSFGNFIYNVAGATPLIAWTAVYGNVAPVPQRALGAPRWSKSDATVLFKDPPETISSRSGGGSVGVLSAMSDWSPQRQLAEIDSDSSRQVMVLAHARWDSTSSRDIIDWLSLARVLLPRYGAVLEARLAEQPNDVVLLRTQQDGLRGAERGALCASHRQRAAAAPSDADLAYVAARCQDDSDARMAAFLRGRGRWPQHPWFAMGVGYGYAATGKWLEALPLLEEARRKIPPLADQAGVDLARIHRVVSRDSARVVALVRSSPQLELMLALESGAGLDSSPMFAYQALARGDLDNAVYRARADSDVAARVLRLAAASDGASRALVQRALALPPDAGMDVTTRWVTIGLAMRERREYRSLMKSDAGMVPEYTDALSRFLELAWRGRPVAVAEAQLRDLPLSLRGLAYSAAVIAMGRRAPPAWRHGAQRLLFAYERPYFR